MLRISPFLHSSVGLMSRALCMQSVRYFHGKSVTPELQKIIERIEKASKDNVENVLGVNFKERLWIDSFHPQGHSNVQYGVAAVGVNNADILRSPNKKWHITLDPANWSMWEVGASWHHIFQKELLKPSHVVLSPFGELCIKDIYNKKIWVRGPYPNTRMPYELRCEDTPDLALNDGTGKKLWSAVRDGLRD